MLKKIKSIHKNVVFGVFAIMALTFTFAAIPTQAASAQDDDWEYAGSFYWRDSCDEAGRAGIPRAWSDYYCDGSGWPWDDYDLYVKYN